MTTRARAHSIDAPTRKVFLPFSQPDIGQAEIDEGWTRCNLVGSPPAPRPKSSSDVLRITLVLAMPSPSTPAPLPFTSLWQQPASGRCEKIFCVSILLSRAGDALLGGLNRLFPDHDVVKRLNGTVDIARQSQDAGSGRETSKPDRRTGMEPDRR